jgi:hypothetical protein
MGRSRYPGERRKDFSRGERPAVFCYMLGDNPVAKKVENTPPRFLYPLDDSDALLIEQFPRGYHYWEFDFEGDRRYFGISKKERRGSQKIQGKGVTVTPYVGVPNEYILDWHK